MPVVKHGASAVLGDKIYFVGGSYEDSVFVTRLQIYDPLTDRWSEGASPPQGGVNQGSAFATTGERSLRRIYVLDTNLRIYDPEKNEWTLGPIKPTNRDFMGIVYLNDRIYAIGGLTRIFPSGFLSPPYPTITTYNANEVYTPFGYGPVPPVIEVASPENKNYTSSEVALNFTVNRQAEWMSYSLDGQENVTVTGNATLAGLSAGLHNVTVYATDEFGNTGVSETVIFNVAEEPFPVVPVAAASVATIAVVGVGLLVYFKRRNH
jgi:hypothetical protein